MQPDSLQASQPRSKIEFLYRDLLIEYERLSTRNEALTERLQEVSISFMGLPTVLRDTASMVSKQACTHANQQIQEAARILVAAEQDLKKTGANLLRISQRNIWFVASVSTLCGLFGGLLGAWTIASLLQGQ